MSRRMNKHGSGRGKAKAGKAAVSIEDLPRLNIRATAEAADRLLARFEAVQSPSPEPDKPPPLDKPYTPKWWE